MRKRLASLLIAGSATAAAVMLAAPAAFASGGTWSISPANTNFTGTSSNTVLEDTTSPLQPQISCTSSDASGTTGAGTVTTTPAQLATVSATFSNCSDVLGGSWSATLTSANLLGDTYDSSTGTTTGEIDNVMASVSGSVFGSPCSFDVTGNIPDGDVAYTNSTGPLAVSDTTPQGLTLTHVTGSGCSLVGISEGDTSFFTASYTLTSPAGGITVTDP